MFPVERLPGRRSISGSLALIPTRPTHLSSYSWKQFIRKIDHLLSEVSMKQFVREPVLTLNSESRLRTDLLSTSRKSAAPPSGPLAKSIRSEERRVGKEW